MSDSILYNQEVTADILNDIAIDLGNTSFNGFGEEKFGADELNDITASLVTAGVLMSGNKCEPIASNGYVNIQTGVMVFQNGAKKKITEVISLELINNTYIYVLNNVTSGTCELIMSENDPTTDEMVSSQDYIPIANIDSEGNVIDNRMFSSAKVIIPAENQYYNQTFSLDTSSNNEEIDVVRATLDIGHPFKIAYAYSTDYGRYSVAFLEDGVKSDWIKVGISTYTYVAFERTGTKIDIYTRHSGSGGSSFSTTIYFA